MANRAYIVPATPEAEAALSIPDTRKEARNAKARERYAARKAAAEAADREFAPPIEPEDIIVPEPVADGALLPGPELIRTVVQGDPASEAPVFVEPVLPEIPGTYHAEDYDIKTPKGLARAHLDLAQREVSERIALVDKYEKNLRWRQKHQPHLVQKYEELIADAREALGRAEVELVARQKAYDEIKNEDRLRTAAEWATLGDRIATALGFSDWTDDGHGQVSWRAMPPNIVARYDGEGNWDVILIDAEEKPVFGYDARVYAPYGRRAGDIQPAYPSWGSTSTGMKSAAAGRAYIRVLTVATRIAEAMNDGLGHPRSQEGDPA